VDYLNVEFAARRGPGVAPRTWTKHSMARRPPQQKNAWDCGVFVCQYALCLATKRQQNFTAADMPNFRKLMQLEILNGRLTDTPTLL
jgi:sentrin-specific protease 1